MAVARQKTGRARRRAGSSMALVRWAVLACFAVMVLLLVAFELGSMNGTEPKRRTRTRPLPRGRDKNAAKPLPEPKVAPEAEKGRRLEATGKYDYDLDLSQYKLAVEYMETLTGQARGEEDPLGLAAGAFKVPPFSSCIRTAERILGSLAFCDHAWRSGLQMGRVDMVADTLLLAADVKAEPNTLLVLQDPRQDVLDSETLECNVCGLVQDVVALDRVLGLYRASPVSLRQLDLPWVKSSRSVLLAVEPDLDVTKSRHTSSLSLTWDDYLRELSCLGADGPTCLTRLGNREWVMLAAFDYLIGNKQRMDKNGCHRHPGAACVRELDNIFWTMEDRSRLVLVNNVGAFGEVEEASAWLDGLHRWPADFVTLLEGWEEANLGGAVVGHLEAHYPLVWNELLCESCELPAAVVEQTLNRRLAMLLADLRSRISVYAILVVEDWVY